MEKRQRLTTFPLLLFTWVVLGLLSIRYVGSMCSMFILLSVISRQFVAVKLSQVTDLGVCPRGVFSLYWDQFSISGLRSSWTIALSENSAHKLNEAMVALTHPSTGQSESHYWVLLASGTEQSHVNCLLIIRGSCAKSWAGRAWGLFSWVLIEQINSSARVFLTVR